MDEVRLGPVQELIGQPSLPHDKSISHRALLMAATAFGHTRLHNLSQGEDVFCTRTCLEAMGARIVGPDHLGITHVYGTGPKGLRLPQGPLDCGNSGTTMRLLMGLIAGLCLPGPVVLVGDRSLSTRPMGRVAEPLRAMGARIALRDGDRAPVTVGPHPMLIGQQTHLDVASGQLKGALLLAGLNASNNTILRGALGGRDHTERMLKAFGVSLHTDDRGIFMAGDQKLTSRTIVVPKDVSAAAFWMTAASLVDTSDVLMEGVGLNPTRTGFIRALRAMGGTLDAPLEFSATQNIEPLGPLRVRRGRHTLAPLKGICLAGSAIAPLIDEVPLIMLLATQACGRTDVRDAGELRVKETDRLEAMAHNLGKMGAKVVLHHDGCTIDGPQRLIGATLESFGDHRIAMASAVAALVAKGVTTLVGAGCMAVSDPHFLQSLAGLCGPVGPKPNPRPMELL